MSGLWTNTVLKLYSHGNSVLTVDDFFSEATSSCWVEGNERNRLPESLTEISQNIPVIRYCG